MIEQGCCSESTDRDVGFYEGVVDKMGFVLGYKSYLHGSNPRKVVFAMERRGNKDKGWAFIQMIVVWVRWICCKIKVILIYHERLYEGKV